MNWNELEIELLYKFYEKEGPAYLENLINRSRKSISNNARKLGLKFDSSNFYKSDEFDIIVRNSKNLVDICRNLNIGLTGGNRITIKKWIRIKKLDTSHFYIERKTSNSIKKDIFVENSTSDRRVIKEKLYRENIKDRKCISFLFFNGKP